MASVWIWVRNSTWIRYMFTDSLRAGSARTIASQQLSDTENLWRHGNAGRPIVRVGVRVLVAFLTLSLVVTKTLTQAT